eukprot:scaffold9512_cov181-Amphora_coffeaeformis.AAC.2
MGRAIPFRFHCRSLLDDDEEKWEKAMVWYGIYGTGRDGFPDDVVLVDGAEKEEENAGFVRLKHINNVLCEQERDPYVIPPTAATQK